MIAMRLDCQKMQLLTVQNMHNTTHISRDNSEIRLVFPFVFKNNPAMWLSCWVGLDLGLAFPFLFFPFMFLDKYVRSTKVCLGTASQQQQESCMQVSHHQQRQKVRIEGEDGSHTPHRSSNNYQSTDYPTTPPSLPRDHFNVHTMKYPSKYRLFLW